MLCQANVLYRKGVACSFKGTKKCTKDGKYYCGRHIRRFEVNFQSIGANRVEDCAICHCSASHPTDVTKTTCNHTFHTACIDEWTKTGATTCPICSARISFKPDPVAIKLRKNKSKYAGFQLWCIQKRLGKKLIHKADRNKYFCFKTAKSLSLKDELNRIHKLSPDAVFESLMTLCQHNPTVISDHS